MQKSAYKKINKRTDEPMDKFRSHSSTKLFKLAAKVYDAESPLRKEVGNMLFRLAALVGKDKEKKGDKI